MEIIFGIYFIIFFIQTIALADVSFLDASYVKVEPEIFYFNYWEVNDNHDLFMKEYGLMKGVSLSYHYNSNFLFKVEGKFAYGNISYDGSTSDGHPVKLNNVFDYTFEIRELIGKQFSLNSEIFISPFLGLGYRNLNDELGKASYLGYKRESNYLYLPIIIQTSINLKKDIIMYNEFEYDLFFLGIQNSYLSDVNPVYSNVRNIQNQGFGLTDHLSFSVPLFNSIISTKLFIRYWHVEKSSLAYLKKSGENIG
ncbi:MAG TPA: hypothetical protein GXX68_03510 [Defluviitoga tunisiensis]|nr:hypothetical protein [Defluviitoga tunisiensis]